MKKYYTLILFSVLCFSGNAQYTITSASNPVPGDVESYTLLDTIGLKHGTSGTGQTWNYSSTIISTVATTPSTYVAMSSVPNSFMFPGATIASGDGSGYYSVFSNNATKIEIIGQAAPTVTGSILYSNPIKLYSLPFSYGTASPDNFAFSGPGYTITGTFTTTGDGIGTLILPTGTYPNVLKQKLVVYESITSGTTTATYTVVESRYSSATSKFPLLTIDTQTGTTVSGTTTTTYDKSGQINGALITGINEPNIKLSEFSIYPNPNSNGIVNMVFTNSDADVCEITVFNALGQSVKTISFNSLSAGLINKCIDLSELESGIYYIHLKAGKEEHTQRLTIMH